jgi:hypothetical protein
VDHQGFIAIADEERRAAISAPFPVTFHGAMTEVCRAFPPAAKKFRYSLTSASMVALALLGVSRRSRGVEENLGWVRKIGRSP